MPTLPCQLEACERDLYAVYEAAYAALARGADRTSVVASVFGADACDCVRAGCALGQAIADVERDVPRRSREHFRRILLREHARHAA